MLLNLRCSPDSRDISFIGVELLKCFLPQLVDLINVEIMKSLLPEILCFHTENAFLLFPFVPLPKEKDNLFAGCTS